MSGAIDGGSCCIESAYGCCYHGLSSFVKDMCKESTIRETLEKTIKLGSSFQT